MDCCLWFNRCRISDAAEIAENFDIAALRGYFLGGRLVEWLREHGGEAFADKLEKLDPASADLDVRLSRIFGKEPPDHREVFCGIPAAERGVHNAGSFAGSGAVSSYYAAGSGVSGSFGAGSRGAGSFFYGSGYYGSFLSGSYSGSFLSGSYSGGSYGSFRKFRLWEWEWEWRFGGSFRGSFAFGSYVFGSVAYLLGSFNGSLGGSFPGGSFGSFTAKGSFGGAYGSFCGWNGMTAEEYDRIMYECLCKCPLDCFGYGIHII